MRTSIRTRSSDRRRPARPPQPRSTRVLSRSASGFTLLELAIVLLVLGIAVSFLIPRLRDVESTRLTASAERLATTARYLYDEAAFRQRPMRFNFDLDNQTYWVTVLNDDVDDPEFVADGSSLASAVALPDAVAFTDVVLPAVGTITDGVVFAEFTAEGYADPLVVHLQNRRGDYATVALDALTGRTRIADGYHEIGLPAVGRDRRDDRRDGALEQALRRSGPRTAP